MKSLVLASQSPRRKQLLSWAEIPFEVWVSEAEEDYPPGLSLEEVPVHIAQNKAQAVVGRVGMDRWVLAADTIVVLGSEVLGKPVDAADARRILAKLSGQTHQVITGVVLQRGEERHSFADLTEVQFHTLTSQQIDYYVDHYEPFDKAGAYAIQEWIGVVGIHSIRGDFYNVMGLPVSRVMQLLKNVSML